MKKPNPDGTTSVKEAAAFLSIGLTKTNELIAAGELDSVKLGRRRLVKRRSLLELIGEAENEKA